MFNESVNETNEQKKYKGSEPSQMFWLHKAGESE